MRKRFISTLAAFLCASMLCGCAADEMPADSSAAESVSDSAEADTSPAEVVTSEPNNNTEPTQSDNSSSAPAESSSSQTTASEITGGNSTAEPTPSAEPPSTDAPATANSATDDASSQPQESAGFTLNWALSSNWEENGKKCGGYEVTLVNNTGSAVNSWTAEISVPDGFEISASWNGIFSVSGTTLTVKNESYNGTIEPGGKAGFGFNYSCPADFAPGKATVNGTSAGNGIDAQEENKPVSTTSSTTEAAPPAPADPEGTTPVAVHGQLSVNGAQLVDQNGNAYQLRGMSTHGITWFPDFVNENSFQTLRDDWNTNVVRMAMYVDEWGNGQCYMHNKQGSIQMLEKGVDICIKLGMYVIIDWHILNPGDPGKYTNEAIEFFDYITEKYADYPNVLYEIANEPNSGADWSNNVKPYAEKVIPVIRENDKDAVIIVGTPTWSQDIDQALASPLDFDNVMYALHFYAATHTDWLRERAEKCVNSGLPVFVSEFGCCDASGNGSNDFVQAQKWLELLDEYNISYCNWALANKQETCSAFQPSASANGNWSDSELSEVGAWIKKWFKSH